MCEIYTSTLPGTTLFFISTPQSSPHLQAKLFSVSEYSFEFIYVCLHVLCLLQRVEEYTHMTPVLRRMKQEDPMSSKPIWAV